MIGKLKHAVAWAALVAWLSASGLSWDLLQLTAYVNMSATNARTMSGTAAVSKALRDDPCPLCKAAREGRAQAARTAAQKEELTKVKTKVDADATGDVIALLPPTTGRRFALPEHTTGTLRVEDVPVPPPRA